MVRGGIGLEVESLLGGVFGVGVDAGTAVEAEEKVRAEEEVRRVGFGVGAVTGASFKLELRAGLDFETVG